MGWAERRKKALQVLRALVIRRVRDVRQLEPGDPGVDAKICELLDALADWKGRGRDETHPRAHLRKTA